MSFSFRDVPLFPTILFRLEYFYFSSSLARGGQSLPAYFGVFCSSVSVVWRVRSRCAHGQVEEERENPVAQPKLSNNTNRSITTSLEKQKLKDTSLNKFIRCICMREDEMEVLDE